MEKYESGKLVDDLSHITTQIEQNGSIIFTSPENFNEKQKNFTIGIENNGSTSSINGVDENADGLAEMSRVWSNIQGTKTWSEGKVTLASICYSNDEHGVSELPSEFLNDVAGHMDELKQYDVAYLLKATFTD